MASREPLCYGTAGIQQLQSGDNLTAPSALLNAGSTDEALTIASGVITVTTSRVQAETEGLAASDDLDTINGGGDGDIVVLRANDSARTVVAKHGTGNLFLDGAADKTLDHVRDILTLINVGGTEWHQLMFFSGGV